MQPKDLARALKDTIVPLQHGNPYLALLALLAIRSNLFHKISALFVLQGPTVHLQE